MQMKGEKATVMGAQKNFCEKIFASTGIKFTLKTGRFGEYTSCEFYGKKTWLNNIKHKVKFDRNEMIL